MDLRTPEALDALPCLRNGASRLLRDEDALDVQILAQVQAFLERGFGAGGFGPGDVGVEEGLFAVPRWLRGVIDDTTYERPVRSGSRAEADQVSVVCGHPSVVLQ